MWQSSNTNLFNLGSEISPKSRESEKMMFNNTLSKNNPSKFTQQSIHQSNKRKSQKQKNMNYFNEGDLADPAYSHNKELQYREIINSNMDGQNKSRGDATTAFL